jgi:integrase
VAPELPRSDPKPQLRAITTLGEAFDALLHETAARVESGVRSAATLEMQRQHVRYLLTRLPASTPLAEIDEAVIDQLATVEGQGRRKRADGVIRPITTSTIKKRLSTLSRALKLQKRKRGIDRLPEFPEILSSYRPDMKFIATFAEARKIAHRLPEHRAAWFWLALWTGQHPSDVERMTKADMQPVGKDRWVLVRNTKNRRFSGTRIACPAELANVFGDRWAELKPGASLVEPWPHVSSQLPYLCECMDLPRYTAKSLRHTFFTWMISKVGITKAVMEIGGWSTYEMVVKVYGHALMPQFRDAVQALDTFVSDERGRQKNKKNLPPALQAPEGKAAEGTVAPSVLQAPTGPVKPTTDGSIVSRAGKKDRGNENPQSVGAERIELSTNGLRVYLSPDIPPHLERELPARQMPPGAKWDPTAE